MDHYALNCNLYYVPPVDCDIPCWPTAPICNDPDSCPDGMYCNCIESGGDGCCYDETLSITKKR